MKVHVIGNKGVVGSATYFTLQQNKMIELSGSDINVGLLQPADVYLICTPEAAVPDILRKLPKESLNVIRSTMRPDILDGFNKEGLNFCVNPEFLKESTATWDCYFAKHILIGEQYAGQSSELQTVWSFLEVPIIVTGYREASMIKLVSNVYSAMLITMWNYFGTIMDDMDIDSFAVSRILPMIDERVSKYGTILGAAYGGKCLPKDVKQLINMCAEKGLSIDLLIEMERINNSFKTENISRGGL